MLRQASSAESLSASKNQNSPSEPRGQDSYPDGYPDGYLDGYPDCCTAVLVVPPVEDNGHAPRACVAQSGLEPRPGHLGLCARPCKSFKQTTTLRDTFHPTSASPGHRLPETGASQEGDTHNLPPGLRPGCRGPVSAPGTRCPALRQVPLPRQDLPAEPESLPHNTQSVQASLSLPTSHVPHPRTGTEHTSKGRFWPRPRTPSRVLTPSNRRREAVRRGESRRHPSTGAPDAQQLLA